MFPDYKDDNGDYRVDSFMGTLDGKGHKIKIMRESGCLIMQKCNL